MGIQLSRSRQVGLASYWFALNFQGAALLTIAVPSELMRVAQANHTQLLARLAALGAVVAMLLPPVAGALSDRLRSRGGRRGPLLFGGTAVNALGLLWIGQAQGVAALTVAFMIAVAGQTFAGASFQAMMPEAIPRGRWGEASGYMGVASLLGTVCGLAAAGLLPLDDSYTAMAVVAVAGMGWTLAAAAERPRAQAVVEPSPRIRDRHDFVVVFVARMLVMLGQTLLMTFVLYYFQDVLHAADAARSTALVAALALVGAVASSFFAGRLSDRGGRAALVLAAGLPMAAAAGGFALFARSSEIMLFAVLYGLGYGAYVSVDWALALDAIPDLHNVARDLGIWGIASNLPAVVAPPLGGWLLAQYAAPAIGYRSLFLLAAGAFLVGSAVVLGVRETRRPLSAIRLLRLFVALILRIYVGIFYRVDMRGRVALHPGTLVVANHGHDLEGMVIPVRLSLGGPVRTLVHSAASQRLFEPGFLAQRAPRWLGRWIGGVDIGPLLRLLGVLPIENMPRRRPAASLAYEIFRLHGNLAVRDVFEVEQLARLLDRPIDRERLKDLWSRHWLPAATALCGAQLLAAPYRQQLRAALRRRVEGQIATLQSVLHDGGALYLTPEGAYTNTGRLRRFRAALEQLLPIARHVCLAATSYDPLRCGPLRMLTRLVPWSAGRDLRLTLLAARPLTISQLLCKLLRERPGPWTGETMHAALQLELASLPPAAVVCPQLRRRPGVLLRRALRVLERRGAVARAHGRLVLVGGCRDARFAEVDDIVAYLANACNETLAALRALAAPAAAQEQTASPPPRSP